MAHREESVASRPRDLALHPRAPPEEDEGSLFSGLGVSHNGHLALLWKTLLRHVGQSQPLTLTFETRGAALGFRAPHTVDSETYGPKFGAADGFGIAALIAIGVEAQLIGALMEAPA
jgi:hypothetical protein